VRRGTPDAGDPLPGLTTDQSNAFEIAKDAFQEVASVTGNIEDEDDAGLGPTFNMNSCVGCHSQPAIGGTSPRLNPQVKVATLHGAKNVVPSFITADGPVREVRFKRKPDGSLDGGVHGLFVITGRSDAPAANRAVQPDFATELRNRNLSFRIPTPAFGAGLIEAITEETILANKQANSNRKNRLGIAGHENRIGNDGTITRFGWKAQNKSLLMFSGEAYNVEIGITNDLFPNARESGPGWSGNPEPENTMDLATGGISDIEQFTIFMRLLAPPSPDIPQNIRRDSVDRGKDRFSEVGCVLCHTESMTTGSNPVAALSNKKVSLFSDLLVHNMGPRLADDVSQGNAGGDEFRTAPLWGLGQRIFFLHDGRTKDLVEVIATHASNGNGKYPDSEANRSIAAFNDLRPSEQQDLLNFLRSL
jgi:CxxC motif-containing protein (DUF1111 family)